MTEKFTIKRLQKLIGYPFSQPKILRHARTRRQFFQRKKSKEESDTMEPLATLGDAVLDLIVIRRLYEDGIRDEGVLSAQKVHDVRKQKTRELAKRIHYEKYVRWGKGEKNDKIWIKSPEPFDTCIEALIGAVFLDAHESGKNGLKYAEKMLEKMQFFEK